MDNTSLLHTPLHKAHLALGARMVPFAGYEMPVQYTGIIEEHRATRASAAIFDVSHMAQFRISGSGARAYLQHMLTNDLALIDEVGAAQYTLLLNKEGGILDDLIVYHTGFEYLIVANASNRQTDLAWLEAHRPDDVELVDESDRTALIALQGPESARIMAELTEGDYELPKRFHLGEATLGGNIPALVARTGYTGEDGVELVVRAQDAEALWQMLLSFPEVVVAGLGARDTLRLEMGYHLYGNDMNSMRNPIEAQLGWVCPAQKTGYIGSEAVADARSGGVAEKLAWLRIEGGIARHGQSIYKDADQVGTVGSGSHSPSYGFGMATAYLPVALTDPGTIVTIEIRRKLVDAVVVKPPFGL